LIVEDDPLDLDLALRALRKANLAGRIQIARDGVEALQFVFCQGPHSERKIENNPKIILLDLKLPKMDGLEVIKHLKSNSNTQSIPVVMFTSSKEENDVVRSYDLGANSYIVKPVNFERLCDALQQLGLYWLRFNHLPRLKG
jgi:two-component system response regulator